MQVIHKPKPKPELMTQTELLAYVHELEQENRRLEESFQKATGAVAADTLPTLAEMRKVSEMCKHNKCKSKNKKCPYFNAESSHCRFENGADFWDFGGADNESAR